MSARFAGLLSAFFLSGLAGLIYETAWTREFTFLFGATELAVSVVLAAYFGGLALGAVTAGRFAARLRRPLHVYAALELVIAASALAVPLLLRHAMQLHAWVLSVAVGPDLGLEGGGWISAVFYLAASFAILVLPTGAMGATLPVLAQASVRSEAELGRRVGLLYGINTFGAVLGTAGAGFWLLPELGLARTVYVAAILNGIAGLVALALARGAPAPELSGSEDAGLPVRVRTWILPAIAASGAIAFLYEVLWTRLLVHLFGGSVYAFATMLAAFLAGIALGATGAARFASSESRALRGFAWAQALAALATATAYALLGLLPPLFDWAQAGGFGRSGSEALLAGAVLLPGAVALGAAFPFAVRIAARSAREAGAASARVYGWNTLGAIAGALAAGYWIIPTLGFAGATMLGIAGNLGLGAFAAWKAGGRARLLAAACAAGAGFLLAHPLSAPWSLLRASPFGGTDGSDRVIHYGVGRNASVLVLEHEGEYALRSNGLPEAVIQPPGARAQRYPVTHWLGALPTALRPGVESLLVVGLGGGVVLEGIAPSVARVDVVEIEREIVRANRAVGSLRGRDPLRDPRVHVHVNDARNALLVGQRRFDAVVSQPSHPWTSGSAHLYTREFFELVRDHLEPEGVFVQWIGLAFVDGPLLRTLLATVADVFPHVRAYRPARRPALLIAASKEPFAPRHAVAAELARQAEHYGALGWFDVLDLEAAWTLDEAGVAALAEGVPRNLDRRNQLEARSPAVAYASRRARPLDWLGRFDPLPARAAAYPSSAMARRLLDRGEPERAKRLLERAPAAERAAGQALLTLARNRIRIAERRLENVLAQAPRHPEARAARLRLAARSATPPRDPPVAPPTTRLEEACWRAWSLQRAGRGEAARDLEEPLSLAHPREALFRDALRARAGWRIAADDGRPLQTEALALLDLAIVGSEHPADLLRRAETTLRAGYLRGTVSTLSELLGPRSRAARRSAAFRARVERVLAGLPEAAPFGAWRRRLEARLRAVPASPAPAASPADS